MKKVCLILCIALLATACSMEQQKASLLDDAAQTNEVPIPDLSGVSESRSLVKNVAQNTQSLTLSALTIPTTSYEGNSFTVVYPITFTPRPQEPSAGRKVLTDSAYFTSSEGSVEMYVGVDTLHYTELSTTETLVSVEQGVSLVRDAKGDYLREFRTIETGTGTVVFGMWYRNNAAYEKYKDVYDRFQQSFLLEV